MPNYFGFGGNQNQSQPTYTPSTEQPVSEEDFEPTPTPVPETARHAAPETTTEAVEADVESDRKDEDAPEAAAEPTKPAPSRGKGKRSASGTKAAADKTLIKRAVRRAGEVEDASETDRELLAALLKCPSDTEELVVAILTAPRDRLDPLGDVTRLAAIEDDISRALAAMSMEPAQRRGVWSVLHHFGLVTDDKPPASDVDASKAIATALSGSADTSGITRVANLARRTW